MKPTLLVLAAGIGSRYGGLKQIDPVGPSGEIIIDYSIYDAIQAGFGKIVFVIRKDIEGDFKSIVSSKYEGKMNVEYAFQELSYLPEGFSLPPDRKKPWGTGHAILTAEKNISEPFAVINADDFYGRSGYDLLFKHLSEAKDGAAADYSMVGFVLKNTVSEHGSVARGVCRVGEDGSLADVVERTKIECVEGSIRFFDDNGQPQPLSGNEIVSMNMWGFTPSIFGHLRAGFTEFLKANLNSQKAEFFIPTVVAGLVKEGKAKVKVLKSADSWFGITYREDKPIVVESIRDLVRQGKYPARLF